METSNEAYLMFSCYALLGNQSIYVYIKPSEYLIKQRTCLPGFPNRTNEQKAVKGDEKRERRNEYIPPKQPQTRVAPSIPK